MNASMPITQDAAVASAQHAFDRLLLAGESQTLDKYSSPARLKQAAIFC
jgi:hypothetical protein